MTTPIPAEDLPRLLAEAMNWKRNNGGTPGGDFDYPDFDVPPSEKYPNGSHICDFSPHLSHDHAQICVEECQKRSLMGAYRFQLIKVFKEEAGPRWVKLHDILIATPAQKSFAALAALTGK